MGNDDDNSVFAPHLARLRQVWVKNPVYFITTCVAGRRPLLADERITEQLRYEWREAKARHGWQIGRYVVMPDHVHFFAVATDEAEDLSKMIGRWKEWTAKSILRRTDNAAPVWQHRFFDHVLRSRDSYVEKWAYVWQNPVRAGLVSRPEDWPHAGHIHFDDPR